MKPGDVESPEAIKSGLSQVSMESIQATGADKETVEASNRNKGAVQPSMRPVAQPVALRVELATKREAQVMQWVAWLLMLLLCFLSIALVASKAADNNCGEVEVATGQPQPGCLNGQRSPGYHIAILVLACLALGTLLGTAVFFVARTLLSFHNGLVWTRRHKVLAVDAAVIMGLEIIIATCWVAPTAAVVGASCTWPFVLAAAFKMVRDLLMITIFFWMLVMMSGMTRYRPPDIRRDAKKWALWVWGAPAGIGRAAAAAANPHAKQGPGQGGEGADGVAAGSGASNASLPASCASSDGGGKGALGLSTNSLEDGYQGKCLAGAGDPGVKAGAGNGVSAAAGKDQLPQESKGASAAAATQAEAKAGALAAVPSAAAAPAAGPARTATSPPLRKVPGAAAKSHYLVIDRPIWEQVKFHWLKITVWVVLVVLTIVNSSKQLEWDGTIPLSQQCAQELGITGFGGSRCGLTTRDRIAAAIQIVAVVGYLIAYIVVQHRAFRDHKSLPYIRYRMTNLYIRVQVRFGTVMLSSVTLSVLVERVAASSGSCWTFLEGQLGFLPDQLALVALAMASGVMYMPTGSAGASVLQSWLQEFAWTEEGLAGARSLRNEHLQQLAATVAEEPARKVLHILAPYLVSSWSQAQHSAAAELSKEPMLCFETALRLFYWSRFAYACTPETAKVFVKSGPALDLFGLQHYEVVLEQATETLGVIGWGGPGCNRVVLSFRGTANLQNVLTDVKFWKTPYLPKKRHHGRLILVHSGFYKAWRAGDFGERVLSKLEEVVGGLQLDPSQLTIYVTGHSLGGALANHGAYQVQKRWSTARVRCYTFGAPRTGNSAWAGEYNATVPDTWMLINHNDPVPRIPKFLYKRCGHRVTITEAGDIIVRPSYFELSVLTKSGGTVKDHMTGSGYALSLAAIMKAQFSEAKSLPGGDEGVTELVGHLDCGKALVMANIDLASLADPAVLPVPLEKLAAEQAQQQQRKRQLLPRLPGTWCAGSDGGKEVQETVQKLEPSAPPELSEAKLSATEQSGTPKIGGTGAMDGYAADKSTPDV